MGFINSKAKSYGHPNQENFIGQGFAVA